MKVHFTFWYFLTVDAEIWKRMWKYHYPKEGPKSTFGVTWQLEHVCPYASRQYRRTKSLHPLVEEKARGPLYIPQFIFFCSDQMN